jgi:GNAT superfamily N-acetyltransferase
LAPERQGSGVEPEVWLQDGSCLQLLRSKGISIVTVELAGLSDRREAQKLIAEYHASEGLTPIEERISWAVDQQLSGEAPGLLLVAREKEMMVGVALAVYTPSAELGRVITVNDFFVRPAYRRRGVGRALAKRLIQECRSLKVDEIGLEVLSPNKTAALFWKSVGFSPSDRFLFRFKIQ